MKHIVFYREDSKFTDILMDPTIKKEYKTKILFTQHLILGFPEYKNSSAKLVSYIMLKYGDDVKDFSHIVPDRTPIMNVDYLPKKK